MFQSPIPNIIANFNQQLCAHGCRYTLVYVDAGVNGTVGIRMSSNVEPTQIAGLFGSLLEASDRVKQMLSDLFKAHPMFLPVPPSSTTVPDATPVLVEVPVEQATEMVLSALLTNLQLKGAVKPPSPIVLLE